MTHSCSSAVPGTARMTGHCPGERRTPARAWPRVRGGRPRKGRHELPGMHGNDAGGVYGPRCDRLLRPLRSRHLPRPREDPGPSRPAGGRGSAVARRAACHVCHLLHRVAAETQEGMSWRSEHPGAGVRRHLVFPGAVRLRPCGAVRLVLLPGRPLGRSMPGGTGEWCLAGRDAEGLQRAAQGPGCGADRRGLSHDQASR